MTDAELAPLFAGVRGRMSMLVIDACYAGGFRSLVDRPNVMGLFSSEEDLTSLVANRFKAGGFLSYFLRAGLSGEADDDGDRIVTAGELSTYVRRRFRREGDIPAHHPRGRPQLPEPRWSSAAASMSTTSSSASAAPQPASPRPRAPAPVQVQTPVGDGEKAGAAAGQAASTGPASKTTR